MTTAAELAAKIIIGDADLDRLNSAVNDAPGTYTTDDGVLVRNLRQRLVDVGYKVPVAFASGLEPQDGSFTVTYNGSIYAADPADTPFTTTGTFDSNQWVLINNALPLTGDTINPLVFSAITGDGVTDDTAGFATLATDYPGRDVDLGGLTYAVTTMPSGFNAFNGSWIIGGEVYPLPADRMTAFGNTALTVADYTSTFWECGLVHENVTNGAVLHSFQYFTQIHVADASFLQHSYSEDGGLSVRRSTTIFNPGGGKRIIGAAIGQMSSGRVGGIIGVLDGDDFAAGPFEYWFVYSDDLIGGDLSDSPTWTAVDVTTSVASSTDHRQPYGPLMPGPSGASGDFQVGAYGDGSTWRIRTTDNGTTISTTEVKDNTGLTSGDPQEPMLVETPDGWVGFCRTSTNGNMHVSTAADGLTFTDWTDTGVPLGGNPVHAVYSDGAIQILLSYRTGFSGTNPVSGAVVIETDYATCANNPTDLGKLSVTRIADFGNRGIGYFQSVRMPLSSDDLGSWVHFGKLSESTSTERGASASRVRLSQSPATTRRPEVHAHQAIDNPGFGLSRIASSWVSPSDGDLLADRYGVYAKNTATLSATHTELTNAEREYFPFLTHKLVLTQDINEAEVGLRQRHLGKDAQEIVGLMDGAGKVTVRVYGFGYCPQLRVDFQVNGQVLKTDFNAGARLASPETTGGWMSEFVFSVECLREMTTPPTDWASVTSVDFLLRTADSGERLNATGIAGWFLYFGDPAPYEKRIQSLRPNENYMWSRATSSPNMRVSSGVVMSTTLARFTIATSDLFSTPTITATPANLKIETAGGDVTATGVSAVYATGFEPGVLVLDVADSTASLTPGEAVSLKLTTGSIIASTGF